MVSAVSGQGESEANIRLALPHALRSVLDDFHSWKKHHN